MPCLRCVLAALISMAWASELSSRCSFSRIPGCGGMGCRPSGAGRAGSELTGGRDASNRARKNSPRNTQGARRFITSSLASVYLYPRTVQAHACRTRSAARDNWHLARGFCALDAHARRATDRADVRDAVFGERVARAPYTQFTPNPSHSRIFFEKSTRTRRIASSLYPSIPSTRRTLRPIMSAFSSSVTSPSSRA